MNETATSSADGLVSGGDAVGMLAMGKTAISLLVVVGIILLCAWLLKRIGPNRRAGTQHLRVIASTPVGQRERVVIVEVEGRWLVLGVGGSQVTHLETLDSPPAPSTPAGNADDPLLAGSFSQRLRQAMKHNLSPSARGAGNRRGADDISRSSKRTGDGNDS